MSHRTSSSVHHQAITAAALALVLPGTLLAFTQLSASAAPLPATYTGTATGDILGLDTTVAAPLLPGQLAVASIGHSASTVASDANTTGHTTATSSNLDGTAVLNTVPLDVDSESVTAAPTADPPPRALLPVPIAPLADAGVVTGDVQAAWEGPTECVAAVNGVRTLSMSNTKLAGATLAEVPGVGQLSSIGASETTTATYLIDDADGGADVVTRTTTTVGDIGLLGGQVSVDVTNPVVMEARSDGTTGTAGFVSPPTITATVAGTPVDIPLNAQPQNISLPATLEPIVDLTITAFTPTLQSSGPEGKATLDALLRIDMTVLTAPAPLGLTVADVSMSVATASVQALAPAGGVECPSTPTTTPTPTDTPTTTPTDNPTTTPTDNPTTTPTDNPTTTGTPTTTSTPTMPPGSPTTNPPGTNPPGTNPPGTAAPVIKTPVSGSTVTDTTPEVSGTGEPGSTITVTEGTTQVCRATVRTNGTWSCSPTTPMKLGEHTIVADQTSATGTSTGKASTKFVIADGASDPDGDGLSTQDEVNPTRDGVPATDPNNPDTDGDGLTDGQEVTGIRIEGPFNACRARTKDAIKVRTDPTSKDTDGDGIRDGREVKGYRIKQRVVVTRSGESIRIGRVRSNPAKADTDRDKLTDSQERTGSENTRWNRAKTNPMECDTDGGGTSDGREVKFGSNPTHIMSGPDDIHGRKKGTEG